MDNLDPTQSRNDYILIVEDESAMQELMKNVLETNGYNVFIASDGVEAVETYQNNREIISLVVLDVMLPEMDGRDTYWELKKINPNVKVFFCTGFASLVEIQSLVEKENLYAIQKPFSSKEFLAVVKEILSEES